MTDIVLEVEMCASEVCATLKQRVLLVIIVVVVVVDVDRKYKPQPPLTWYIDHYARHPTAMSLVESTVQLRVMTIVVVFVAVMLVIHESVDVVANVPWEWHAKRGQAKCLVLEEEESLPSCLHVLA